ncbi:cysteine hydrolase family protein [Propionispira raffinosivorans]|uniref:cysteine hydrolase family protein n=1 Tax=Propionispira raffinosivorans TaxID=86959 RepID=UPI0003762E9C|nr:isochorismatase family cysteine hydrolase [Propionispira raffinosivorans]
MNDLILIIDMQNDFIDGSLGTKEAQAIVPRVQKKLFTTDSVIMFTQDTHGQDYLDSQEGKNLPIKHCIKPEKGWEICDTLKPYVTESNVFEKPTFGCTKLIQAVEPYESITIVGLCTDICIISNALLIKAFYPEKMIRVDSKCCAGVTPESHENALKAMRSCQITII